jgi:ribosomal protein S18 acetylase RimI-like enzyme
MNVRRILANDWEAFRALRLDSLRTDPLAFGSTLERESGYPEDRWRGWAESGAVGDQSATFVVEAADGRLRGMAGLFTDESEYHIWGMWVAPDVRGQGLGRDLLDRVLSWAQSTNPGRSVLLDVNPDQTAAVRLYEDQGFRFTGKTTPLGHHPPAVVQEMARPRAGAPPRK